MEEITEGVNTINLAADLHKKNRIQVSNTKKPLFFYVNLAKRYMQQHNEVELSALGMETKSSPPDTKSIRSTSSPSLQTMNIRSMVSNEMSENECFTLLLCSSILSFPSKNSKDGYGNGCFAFVSTFKFRKP